MPRRLRILFIAPYEPSALAVRSRLLLEGMAQRHDVDALTLRRAKDRDGTWPMIRHRSFSSQPSDRLIGLARVLDRSRPLQLVPAVSRELSSAVMAALQRDAYDLVHVEHLRALQYLPRQHPPLLFDAVDCVSHLFKLASAAQPLPRRWVFAAERHRAERLERQALSGAERVLVASHRDAVQLRMLDPQAPVAVVPNPVELPYLALQPRKRNTVLFSGKMSFHANERAAEWFCSSVWPLVLRKKPDAHLVIAGANPSARLRAHAGRHVQVTGFVPNMKELIASANVAVAPLLYAVGVQNKILEAFAEATPVVATPVAVGDLGVQPGRDLVIAQHAVDFAAAVVQLLDDSKTARKIGRAGRSYVERFHAPERVWDLLDAQYRQLLGEMPTASAVA